MKISLTFDDDTPDGTTYEATANRKTLFGQGSKSKFRRQFGVPAVVMGVIAEAITETGLDLTKIPKEHHEYADEEYLAFLVWLEAKRRLDDVPDGDWDTVVEGLIGFEIDDTDEDPTEAATPS